MVEVEAHIKVVTQRATTEQDACEAAKQIWKALLGSQSWEDYYSKLPKPKCTPLQKLVPDRLAAFYYECMEENVLEMMHQQSKRLLDKVEPGDKPFVEDEMRKLRDQLKQTRKKTAEHRKKASEVHIRARVFVCGMI